MALCPLRMLIPLSAHNAFRTPLDRVPNKFFQSIESRIGNHRSAIHLSRFARTDVDTYKGRVV